MKVLVLATTFTFIMGSSATCQNLVRNHSFEEGAGSLCDFMIWASDFNFYVSPWECPTNGTSDIFNSSIPNQFCWAAMPGIPGGIYKRVGSQMPRTGIRFAGIYVYGPGEYREYLHTELTTPLVPGKSYCAEMYVSLADRVQKATSNLGMHFGTQRIRIYTIPTPPYDFFTSFLDVSPQILETNVIQDSISWVKVYGNLLADSAYTHLTIGNFYSNDNTETIHQPGRGAPYVNRGYYFIEDVSVYEIPPKPFSFEGTTTICQGSTTTIKALGGLEEVEWTTLDDTVTVLTTGDMLTVNPSLTTSYRVTGKKCKLLAKDTIEIIVIPFINPDLGEDITICEGTVATLDAGEGYHEYKWQDNSTEQHLAVTNEGIYSVTVKNEFGCTGYDEMEVFVKTPPEVELGDDVVVCDRYPTLSAGTSDYEYIWSTGSTDNSIRPTSTGKYWVTAENMCGVTSDTINIYSYDHVLIPNVITPNNDPKNDVFQIVGVPPSIKPSLIVINRWGKEVASRSNYKGDWPDSQEREELPSGIYYYTVIIPGCKSYKGWLHIVR